MVDSCHNCGVYFCVDHNVKCTPRGQVQRYFRHKTNAFINIKNKTGKPNEKPDGVTDHVLHTCTNTLKHTHTHSS